MKQKILNLLSEKQPLTQKQMEEHLAIDTSADFVVFSKTLEDLEDQFKVIRQKDNSYILPNQNGYKEGVLAIHGKGYGVVYTEDDFIINVEKENLNGALDGDHVVVRLNQKNSTYEIIGIQHHKHPQLTGTYVNEKGHLKCKIDDAKIANTNYFIKADKSIHPVEGTRVLLKVDSYGPQMRLHVDRVIGHKDDPDVDIISVLLNHSIEPEFPEEVILEANLLPDHVTEEEMEGRVDLREECFITIDGDDSKDFDDAVYVEKEGDGWCLKVAIADVSHYVREHSQLDLEALKRGTSIYPVNSVVPMLPHILSNGICSLNPQEERLAITCVMHIRKNGSVQSYDVFPSVIKSHERMTYNNVNRIYDGDAKLQQQYTHIYDMLLQLKQCAQAIRKAREAKGAIDFAVVESEVLVNEIGYAIDVKERDRGIGEGVIEDCMIITNVCIANLMKNKNLPCVYRVHGEPDIKKLRSFKDLSGLLGSPLKLHESSISPKELQGYLDGNKNLSTYPVLANLLLRCMQKAYYDAQCLGHFGIAEDEYLHFTSPIRRYPDLIVHRMLRKYVFEETYDEIAGDQILVKEYADQSSICERNAIEVEREVEDMKKAEYMQSKIGETYTGMITNVLYYGFYVRIPNTVEGFVSLYDLKNDYYIYDDYQHCLVGQTSHKRYQIGDEVEVVVAGANKEMHTIDFELKDVHTTKQQPQTKKHNTRSRSAKATERGTRGKRK